MSVLCPLARGQDGSQPLSQRRHLRRLQHRDVRAGYVAHHDPSPGALPPAPCWPLILKGLSAATIACPQQVDRCPQGVLHHMPLMGLARRPIYRQQRLEFRHRRSLGEQHTAALKGCHHQGIGRRRVGFRLDRFAAEAEQLAAQLLKDVHQISQQLPFPALGPLPRWIGGGGIEDNKTSDALPLLLQLAGQLKGHPAT